jgi:hypothetical protein
MSTTTIIIIAGSCGGALVIAAVGAGVWCYKRGSKTSNAASDTERQMAELRAKIGIPPGAAIPPVSVMTQQSSFTNIGMGGVLSPRI